MVEPLGPELLITIEPLERVAHRLGVEPAGDDAPGFAARTRPASDSTSRCFMIAGSDTGNGAASALTEMSGSAASRITSARRVGSASAAKVRSRDEL